MITPTASDSKLNIILTNTNKALAEAIKHASAEQLTQIQENKDIKSFLNSVFNDKLTASKSDQILLDILKNAPAFKNMGNFSDELNSLLSKIKDSATLSAKAPALETFIQNSSKTGGDILKTQIANSGIFMESKIASAIRVPQILTQNLESLKTLFSQSAIPDAKPIQNAIVSLLSGSDIKNAAHDPTAARKLAEALHKIVDSFQTLVSATDVLYSKQTKVPLLLIDRLASSAPVSSQTAQEIKSTLSQLYGILLSSTAKEANNLLDSIETLLKNFNTVKPSEENVSALKSFTQQLYSAIENPDTAIRSDTAALIAKLLDFSTPKDLILDTLLKDTLEHDLKSQLMKLSEEIQNNPNSSDTELLDPINKLLVQIDYHQLLSHLSASNSIYFPFAWDQLEEGSVSFKKNNEKKFYCEINLKLKEYGKLDLMMALYDENQLELQAHTDRNDLKDLINDNLPTLRSVLIDTGLSPRRLRIFGPNETSQMANDAYDVKTTGSDFGFEVKV